MMGLKLVCFVKRLLIVLISAVLMTSVNIAPDRPLQFAVFAFAAIVFIRLLWRSAEKDERRIYRQKHRLYRKRRDMPQTLRQAA